ncbi:hypothetical protein [Leisingera sp.]|uniref:hypothetical protein n=1 Tax=Leisingera sp. TaxID=1879318 RepID=UPI003A5BED43
MHIFDWFRIGYLTVTLVFLGWYANAQLSVVNLMALAGSLRSGFSWGAFLLDPLVFIQWFAVPPRCCSGAVAPIEAGCARWGPRWRSRPVCAAT